jgi:hypothetical protein
MSNSTNDEQQTQEQKNTRRKFHNFLLLYWIHFCLAIIGIALIVISKLGCQGYISLGEYRITITSALIRSTGVGIVIGDFSVLILVNIQFCLNYLRPIIGIGKKEKEEKKGEIVSAQSKQADEGREKKQMSWKKIGNIVFLSVGVFLIIPLVFVIIGGIKWSAGIQLAVAFGGTILISYIFYFLNHERGKEGKIEENIIKGDESIANGEPDEGVSKVKVMREIGMDAIFKGRGEDAFYKRIKPLFEKGKVINIYDISLRDFFYPGPNQKFRGLWKILKERVEEKEKGLEIRMLIINPQCRGAINRKNADPEDEKNKRVDESQLYKDVSKTIEELMKLMPNGPCGEIKLRLSNCDPLMFMIQTKEVSFVQQHLFGNVPQTTGDTPQNSNGVVPIVEYKGTAKDETTDSCHGALMSHFDYIWDNASTDIFEYRKFSIGFDRAIIEAGIKNAYYRHKGKNEDETCRDRMISLINDEKTNKIWIRGVSLGSFFYNAREEDECSIYNALKAKCIASGTVELHVIVLDYKSDIAKERAWREYDGGQKTFDEFCSRDVNEDNERVGDYWRSSLYCENRDAIKAFYRLKYDFAKSNPKLEIRLFKGNPEGFFFITNESALVEQYHFGRRGGANANKQPSTVLHHIAVRIPGGGGANANKQPSAVPRTEVPVFEYAADKNKQVHQLFESHFEWLFEHSERVPRGED